MVRIARVVAGAGALQDLLLERPPRLCVSDDVYEQAAAVGFGAAVGVDANEPPDVVEDGRARRADLGVALIVDAAFVGHAFDDPV